MYLKLILISRHGEKFPAVEKMSENCEALMAFPKFRYVFSDTIIYAHKPATLSG
jgi:3-deoxy-D-manno-octulosonic-acid transferase